MALPVAPTRPGPGLRPILDLSTGDRVTHDAWGLGVVVAAAGHAENSEVTVDFGGDVGCKRLLLRYAPLEKL